MLSVVMTTYNGARFVERQLASLAAQTVQPDEVLIFDDNSEDGTVEIVRGYIARSGLASWSLHCRTQNIGYKSNFFEAVKAARGDIVFLCDQDDIWLPDKLAVMKRAFESDTRIKALSSGIRLIDEEGRPAVCADAWGVVKRRGREGALKRVGLNTVIRRNIAPGCTLAFDKDCRALYLRSATKQWPHDWEINLFAAMLDGLFYLNRRTVQYRLHAGNAIGLNGSAKDPQTGRLALARAECKRVELYTGETLKRTMGARALRQLEAYAGFVRGRLTALEKASLGRWFALLRRLRTYALSVGLRGVMGDLMYIIKGKFHG